MIRGGSIDLVVASSSLTSSLVECYIDLELDCTSDYQTILTTIKISRYHRGEKPGGRFQLDKIKIKEFIMC